MTKQKSPSHKPTPVEGRSSVEPIIQIPDVALSEPGGRKDERELIDAHFDARLSAEIDWYARVLGRFLPVGSPLNPEMFGRTVAEALMCVGMVVLDEGEGVNTLRLEAAYQRSGPVVVMLLSVCEVVVREQSEGLGPDECLDKALDPGNWRSIEPLPREIRPLIRKYQRHFPVALIRKMPPDLVWFLALPRLVEEELVEWVPDTLQ